MAERHEGGRRRPRRRHDVAELEVGDATVVATEAAGEPLVLDPVAAVLWRSFDGEVPLDALAEDVADALGAPLGTSRARIDAFVDELSAKGYLHDPPPRRDAPRRRDLPRLDPASCLGRRLGLGRATQCQVRAADTDVRVAATLDDVLSDLARHLPVAEIDHEPLEAFILRAVPSPSGRPRLAQVFDELANPLWAGRDLDVAAEALGRTVAGRLACVEGTWVRGVAIDAGDATVLVHPALRDLVVDALRRPLEARGLALVPGGLLELLAPTRAVLPAHPDGTRPARPLTVAAVLVPPSDGPAERLRTVAHLAHRWDQEHLEALAAVAEDDDLLLEVPPGSTLGGLIDLVASRLATAAPAR